MHVTFDTCHLQNIYQFEMYVNCDMSVSTHTSMFTMTSASILTPQTWHVSILTHLLIPIHQLDANAGSCTCQFWHMCRNRCYFCYFWHNSEMCAYSDTCRFRHKCWLRLVSILTMHWLQHICSLTCNYSTHVDSDTHANFDTCWLWCVWALACMSMWQCSIASRWPWSLSCSSFQKLAVSPPLMSRSWLINTERAGLLSHQHRVSMRLAHLWFLGLRRLLL